MSVMNIIVCIKQIIDPEAPSAKFKIDYSKNKVIPPQGLSPVISPFDEQALEAALRIKDTQECKVKAISLGLNLMRNVVKKALSMGADELILLEDEAFSGGDSWSTANALANGIKKTGDYDLILCGRQAADWDAGQVGSGIAEILGLPSVTLAKKIEINDGKARVERVTPDGYEVIEVSMPALITVSNELGEPRMPDVKGIMAAAKKQPIAWKPSDLGLSESQPGYSGRRTKLIKLFQPIHEGKCEIVEGDTPEEAGINLASKLKESKIL
jgi:electron transfer flavoprotein beta subunit